MRRLLLLLVFSPIVLAAQIKFGHFSYSGVMESLPQYEKATKEYNLLKERCDKEIKHNDDELARCYVAFLDGHRDFPEPILRKRQNELQQMIDNNAQFRNRLDLWLAEARDSLYRPCHRAVDIALQKVCSALCLAYAIDTDENVYKYINPDFGIDITAYIIDVAVKGGMNPVLAEGVTSIATDVIQDKTDKLDE